LVLFPPRTPARSIALLSALTDFPVAADPSGGFELLAGQPILSLPQHVIFVPLLFCTQTSWEGSLGGGADPGKGSLRAARPNPVFP